MSSFQVDRHPPADLELAGSLRLGPRTFRFSAGGPGPHLVRILLLVAIALTPVALLLDYRTSLTVWATAVEFVPYAENDGRVSQYVEVFGLAQILWLACALIAVVARPIDLRRQVPAIALFAIAVLIWVVTLATARVDSYTTHALLSTLVPVIGMAYLVCHQDQEVAWLWRCTRVFVVLVGVVCLGTAAVGLLKGTLGDRFDVYLFASPTYSGAVLAGLLPLAASLPRSVRWRVAVAALFLAFILLSQTRGALLGALAAGIVVAAFVPRARKWVLGATVLALLAFIVFSDRSLLGLDASNTLRTLNLERHWALFEDRPLSGYGVSAATAPYFSQADNTLLGLANAAGIGAALLWLVAWLTPLYRAMRVPPQARQALAAPTAAIAATLVTWMTTGNQVLVYAPPTNLIALALAAGIATALAPSPRTWGAGQLGRWTRGLRGRPGRRTADASGAASG